MNNQEQNRKKNIVIGAGLVALDAVMNGKPEMQPQYFAGGSCGNVLAILAYLGWDVYPIARLSDNVAGEILLSDFTKWKVNDDFITKTPDGSTPVIIHRILKDKNGVPKHRFEFRDPTNGNYLPSYKPVLANTIKELNTELPAAKVFYFDRINRAAIDLAKKAKSEGTIVFFEPSNMKDEKQFRECLQFTDILKYSHDRLPFYASTFETPQVDLEIETLGHEGLQYRTRTAQKWKKEPSFTIGTIADSAGAGDWCSAGIIHQLLFTKKPDEVKFTQGIIQPALQFGQALGALNCLFFGARGMMYRLTNQLRTQYVKKLIQKGKIDLIPQSDLLIDDTQKNLLRPIASIL